MEKITILASISGVFLVLGLIQSASADNHVVIPQVNRDCANSDSCFVPTILSIKKGQAVVWQNDDSTIHSLVGGSKDAGASRFFQSGTLMPDDSFSYTISHSGIFHYYCEFHPWMQGVIWAR